MLRADLYHPAVGAALTAAADLLGMEVVFIGGLTDTEFAFHRVLGSVPGVTEGVTLPRQDSFCHRRVSGAPPSTADAANDPAYADVPARATFGITSYVGVPIHASDGRIVGTLCGIDREHVPVTEESVRILETLARVVEAHVSGAAGQVVVRRTPQGWHVGVDHEDELTSAMALADLLADDLEAPPRPPRPDQQLDEVHKLQVAVSQLEHALAARVVVEQAIGVLAERQRVAPRAAFERLRKAARSRGRKVHELARMVVASTNDPAVPLPPELAGRRQPIG
ncbi:MAG TPA: GAF and ANTAR domain-containing protein [Mycobacteriales bacterium]|nr:GAF and ANTAR domain-containing protein [Mycobacteriales bacterium]